MLLDEASGTKRLLALWDHLGLRTAHVAGQIPGELAGLAAGHPDRLSGIVLCAPVRLDPAPFAGVAERLLIIGGERGDAAPVIQRACDRLPSAERAVLAGYDALGWSDVVADRTHEVAERIIAFLGPRPGDRPHHASRDGEHAGISYRLEGSGPALVLLPFFLAPSQWVPAIPLLAEHFTVITLGGRHLGGVAMLEDRARAPTYRALFNTLIDLMGPRPDEAILDVGCGAGSLDRILARRLGRANPIAAIDPNPFLLREAKALAAAEGLADAIVFSPGNAEALPFGDMSVDCVFSVTVLEECDADRAIAEMIRVTRPGGRIGVVVRAIDLPQWWSLDLPDAIRRKVEAPPRSVGRRGVADAGLYGRMRMAGLADLVCFPFLVTLDRPDGPIWSHREGHVTALLTGAEAELWRQARDRAAATGTLLTSHAMHCAVGTKPV
ncbi:MAG: methyltransferase domain-containing protein [Alphaproteobacteria bacterium]|nr:methyltransferase domain-containing protein [Alphaproteobacteria bacterium]